MKKLFSIIALFVATLCINSCAKPGEEVFHTDNSITAIEIRSTTSVSAPAIQGKINQETGSIVFEIPPTLRNSFDPKAVKVRATGVGYDVFITPSLSGIKDLSSGYEITCTAKMTGESRTYVLKTKYTSK